VDAPARVLVHDPPLHLPHRGSGAKGEAISGHTDPACPEATLFTNVFGQDVQIITHFLSPDANPNEFAPKPATPWGNATWQSSFDSSKVWAKVPQPIPTGSDAGHR
jgi:hypothetical protein